MSQVIPNMPFADYLALDAMSAHGIKAIERSPAHYRHERDNPSESSPAQRLGTAAHALILTPDLDIVRAIPEGANKASNNGRRALIDAYLCGIGDDCLPCVITEIVQSKEKSEMARLNDAISQLESIAKSSGLHFVRQSEYDAAKQMRDAVLRHSEAAYLLDGGRTEHTLLYQYGGVDCKARPDLLPRNSPVVVDVKKTLDASKHAFRASIRRYGYDIQAAWYLNAAACSNIRADEFIWLAVESDPPYGIALYSAGIGLLAEGSARYESAISTYRDCLASGEWPSYTKQIETIELYEDAELGTDELTEVDE